MMIESSQEHDLSLRWFSSPFCMEKKGLDGFLTSNSKSKKLEFI